MSKLHHHMLFLSLITLVCLSGCGGPDGGRKRLGVSRDPVSFSVPCARLSGKPVTLEDYEGKPVLLDLSATWTPGSGDNAALLDKLYGEYEPKGLVVVSLMLDEDSFDAVEFVEKTKVAYPVGLADTLMQQVPFSAVRAFPTKWLLNGKHQRVGEPLGGMMSEPELIEHIELLLDL